MKAIAKKIIHGLRKSKYVAGSGITRYKHKQTETPDENTVRIYIRTPGRFLAFFLSCLSEVFEIIEIDRSCHWYVFSVAAELPVGKYRAVRTNKEYTTDHLEIKTGEITIDYDYYSKLKVNKEDVFVLPYYLHADMYIKGILPQKVRVNTAQKCIDLFYSGTHQREAYEKHFHFPILNRYQVIETIIEGQKENIEYLRNVTDLEGLLGNKIVMSLTDDSGNNLNKHLLNQSLYMELLEKSWFFISAPGFSIPHAHSIMEALSVGTVPIFNYNDYFHPALEHGKNCLTFSTEEDLLQTVEYALESDNGKREYMAREALRFYGDFCAPESAGKKLLTSGARTVLVNSAEIKTLPLYKESFAKMHTENKR